MTFISLGRYFACDYQRKNQYLWNKTMQSNVITPAACAKKRVFLRVDLNVPLAHGQIVDDQRLQAIIPTLQLLTKNAACVTIATHLGKPDHTHPDQALSTRQLIPWFAAHGFTVTFAENPLAAAALALAGCTLILLENLRFFPGEQEPSAACAHTLAALADCYVTDAFATLHRNDTSIALLPGCFTPENRFYGLCIARELNALETICTSPQQPFMAVLGGNKLTTKLPLIQQLMMVPPAQRVSHVLLGGLLGIDLDKNAPELIALALQQAVTLLLPIDYRTDAAGNTIDIGPATEELFISCLGKAQTIFANGTMGKYEEKDGQAGTYAILRAIAQSDGFTLLGGGDCAAAAEQCGVADKVSCVSTGGGATLAYLASKKPWQDLPGLQALIAIIAVV